MYNYSPTSQRRMGWADLLVLATGGVFLHFLIGLAQESSAQFRPEVPVGLSAAQLPKYAFYSLIRATLAYALSLLFTLLLGYAAAKNRRAERVIIPLLDIGQSIPVLGFLPGLVLGLIALFPNSNFGIEIACILLIFTGQVWNMAFSYYASLKAIPNEFYELGTLVGLNRWKKLKRIELPSAAIGLAWNSMMSMAGGWFFLTVCESFNLGDRKFRLPGLGSYMALAIDDGDVPAMVMGIIAMFTVIILVDFLVWRPVIAWTKKFRLEMSQEDVADLPFVTLLLKESLILHELRLLSARWKRKNPTEMPEITKVNMATLAPITWRAVQRVFVRPHRKPFLNDVTFTRLLSALGIVLGFWGATRLWELIRPLTGSEWIFIFKSIGYTLLRVTAALILSSVWTIPVGILMGLNPKVSRIFQPFIQIAASFPAPMLYPLAIILMQRLGIGLNIGAVFLMVLGVQWYVLFNVLAGATSISQELRDNLSLMRVSGRTLWWKLYLPSIFPPLVTGWVTAAGGAWNASIIAEFMQFRGHTLVAPGIGSVLSEATAAGRYPIVAGCLVALVGTVITINRLLWRRLYGWAESRFRFER